VNKFGVLARSPRPAGVLTDATEHVPETSPRYRDILRPNGFRDELRFSLVDDGACWGWVALYRRDESGDFEIAGARAHGVCLQASRSGTAARDPTRGCTNRR
jgi:hypothetical protein